VSPVRQAALTASAPRQARSRPSAACDEQLQQVGRQIVELRAAGRAAEVHLDTPAQVVVHVLTEQRGELALLLVTNAAIGQPRRRVLGADDGPAGGVDLQAQLEAV